MPSVWLYLLVEGISNTSFAKKRITIPERHSRPEMADYTSRALDGRSPNEALLLDVLTTASMRAPGGHTGHDVWKVRRKRQQHSVLRGMKMFTLKKTRQLLRLPWHGWCFGCFEFIATTATPPINPHTISQPSWHQGLVFQHNKLQILCPLVEGIPHATYLFGIPHSSSTRVEHLSSKTSRNATFQEGPAMDPNEIDLNYLAPSLASQCVGPRPSPQLLVWKIW